MVKQHGDDMSYRTEDIYVRLVDSLLAAKAAGATYDMMAEAIVKACIETGIKVDHIEVALVRFFTKKIIG